MRLTTRERIILERRTSHDWTTIPKSPAAENLIKHGFMEMRLDPASGQAMWRATAKARKIMRDQATPPLQY